MMESYINFFWCYFWFCFFLFFCFVVWFVLVWDFWLGFFACLFCFVCFFVFVVVFGLVWFRFFWGGWWLLIFFFKFTLEKNVSDSKMKAYSKYLHLNYSYFTFFKQVEGLFMNFNYNFMNWKACFIHRMFPSLPPFSI